MTCNCISLANDALKPMGFRLRQDLMVIDTPIVKQLLTVSNTIIETEPLSKPKRGKKPKRGGIQGAYCPFCGKKYDEESEPDVKPTSREG